MEARREIYALIGALAHRGSLTASDALAARERAGNQSAWEHRLGQPLSFPLPLAGILECGFPRLPGPAALVRYTPLETEPGAAPNFEHDRVKMRELLVCTWKPGLVPADAKEHVVVYKGPYPGSAQGSGARRLGAIKRPQLAS